MKRRKNNRENVIFVEPASDGVEPLSVDGTVFDPVPTPYKTVIECLI